MARGSTRHRQLMRQRDQPTIESARLAGHDPDYYLKAAVSAALDGELIPLPHELPLPD